MSDALIDSVMYFVFQRAAETLVNLENSLLYLVNMSRNLILRNCPSKSLIDCEIKFHSHRESVSGKFSKNSISLYYKTLQRAKVHFQRCNRMGGINTSSDYLFPPFPARLNRKFSENYLLLITYVWRLKSVQNFTLLP